MIQRDSACTFAQVADDLGAEIARQARIIGAPRRRTFLTLRRRGLTFDQMAGGIAAIKRRDRAVESLTEIGRSYNVSAATISRLSA